MTDEEFIHAAVILMQENPAWLRAGLTGSAEELARAVLPLVKQQQEWRRATIETLRKFVDNELARREHGGSPSYVAVARQALHICDQLLEEARKC